MSQTSVAATPFNTFRQAAGPALTVRCRDAAITFSRVGFGQDHGALRVEARQQDAFYVVFQLRDQAAHEHWTGGRATPAPPSPKGGLHIYDLTEPHAALLQGRFDSINILIERAYIEAIAEDAGAGPVGDLRVPEAWTTKDPVLSQLEPVLLGALEDPSSNRLFINHLAAATALHLAERYGGLRRPLLKTGGLAPWQERRATEMIAADLAKETPLAKVAADCGLSLSHFSKAFKVSVGMTPHGWLQARRVERARALLADPKLSFAEIAITCGFADQSHFSRIFKRATGSPPGAWRRTHLR